jgi:hypothetical protein
MANLTPTAAWSDVYKIETTDWVDASRTGVSNQQAQALLNRLTYLYNRYITLYNQMNSYDDPIGTIKIWYKSLAELPTGWQICNGTNGTPDLQNRYVMGCDSDASLNYASGSSTFSLAMVTNADGEHTHSMSMSGAGIHGHYIYAGAADGYLGDNLKWGNYGSYAVNGHEHNSVYSYTSYDYTHTHGLYSSGSGVHSHTLTISNINNLPASVAIYYVMKIS